MFTNIQLGAQVKGYDDSNLGKIKLLVADPDNKQVTHLVVEKGGFDPKQVVADSSLIKDISDDGKTVWLSLSQPELDRLPDFIEREYVETSISGAAMPASPDLELSNGVGLTTPISAGGFVTPPNAGPDIRPMESDHEAYNEHMNVPSYSLLIKEGAEVQALDGKLGKVKRVNLDPNTGQLTSFVVEHGLLFRQEQTIPLEMVDSVTENTVMLKARKDMFLDPVYDQQDSSGEYRSDTR